MNLELELEEALAREDELREKLNALRTAAEEHHYNEMVPDKKFGLAIEASYEEEK